VFRNTRFRPRFVVLPLAALLAFVTCTEDRSPLSPRAPAAPSFDLASGTGAAILAGAGDISQCDRLGDEETATVLDGIAGTVFTAGDNAYPDGSDSAYVNCYDPTWGRHRARTMPSTGNHEYDALGNALPGYADYFGATGGPAGKFYYSYDLGAWHVIVLNSNIAMTLGSEQELWLKADLAAHPNLCTLAYWHHPLYSSWTDSLTGGQTNSKIRPVFTDLYNAGADLVINGHRHWYERFAPQTPAGDLDSARGIRELIVGTGGGGFDTPSNIRPLSEVRNGDTWGVIKLYLYSDGYAWKFMPVAGRTFSDSGSTRCHDAPGGVSGSLSTIDAAPTSILKGTQTSAITVTARDAAGNPVSGGTVTLAATGTGNTLTQTAGSTDANGVATGSLSSTVMETKTVSATVNGIALSQTVGVVVTGLASATKSKVTVSPAYIAIGTGTATVTVSVRDAGNHAVSGAAVVLSASGSGNTVVQPLALTNASGVATGTVSSTVAESKLITATANGTTLSQHPAVNVTTASPAKSTMAASPTTIAAGTGKSTITVTVKDAGGHALAGAAVALAATGSGNTLTQPLALTNTSGVTTGTLVSSVAEQKVVTASANGVGITKTATVTVTASAVSASLSTVVAAPASIAAGTGSATVTVTVKNGSGSPVTGATVVLSATGTGNTLTQPVGTTNASGVATGTLTSTVPEVKAVSAVANGIGLTQTAVVTVTTGAAAGSKSTVVANPASIIAGSGTSTITVTAHDTAGNPVSGATVVLAATGSGNTLTQPAAVTDANGVATGSLASSVTETKTVSATINGVAVVQTAAVTVAAQQASPSLSTLGAAPLSFSAGGSGTTITVTVRNGNGDPIAGANVVLSVTGTQNALTQPAGPTDANGAATGTLTATKAELKTVSATADGIAITQTAQVTVTAGTASGATTQVSAAPTSIAPGSETATIRVTAKDAFGNPVSGVTVALQASGSGNTLGQPGSATNSVGVASGTLSSTVEETKTVSATVDGTAVTQTAQVMVVAPVQGAIGHTLLTSGNDVNNLKVYTTASIAPAANALVTVAVLTHQSAAAAPIPTLTGGGMAGWDVVASIVFDSVSVPHKRLTIFRALSAAPGSGPLTITSTATVSNCQWIVSQWSGVATGGTNGSDAVVQSTSTVADGATSLTASLAPFADAADAAYGAFAINSNVVAITPGTGFTEIDEQPSTESTAADLFTEWAVNLPTVSASWAKKNAGGIALEIRAQ
jgi:Big-like domain-containing protein/invasin-like protein